MACEAGNLITLIDTQIKYILFWNHQYWVRCSDGLQYRDWNTYSLILGQRFKYGAETFGSKRIINQLLEPNLFYKWDSFEPSTSNSVQTFCQHSYAKIICSTLLMLMERLNVLTVSPASVSRRKTHFSQLRFCYCWGSWRGRENEHQQNHTNS